METILLQVLKAFAARNPDMEMHSSIIFMAYFFLIFLLESEAFQMLCYVFESIVP